MAIKKIGYYGKFEPTGPDFSTAKRFQALAGLADQVGETAAQLGQIALKERATKAAKAGSLAGAQVQRDEEGNIIAPELQEENTYYGQAFNESAVKAYKSGISIDARRRFDELSNEFKDDPDAYKEVADKYKQGLIEGLPPELQAELIPVLDQDIYFREKEIRRTAIDNKFKKGLADVEADVSSIENEILYAARNGDTERQQALEQRLYDKIADSAEFIDPIQAKDRIEALGKNVAEEVYLGEMERIVFDEEMPLEERLVKGEKLLSDLRSTDFFKDLTPDEKRILESQVDAKVNDVRIAVAEQKSKRSSEIALEVSNLEIAAKNGLRPGDEIIRDANRLFRNEDISGDERTSIINNVYAQQNKSKDKNTRILDVSDRLKGDPTVTVTQEGIDDYYEEMLEPQLEGMADRSLVQANFISSTRMIPKKVKIQVNQQLISGDPVLVTQAAQLIDRVDEIPGMFDQLTTPATKTFATNMVRLMEVMSPEEAYKRSEQFLGDGLDQDRIDFRRNIIKKEKYQEKYEKWTQDVVGDLDQVSMGRAVNQYQAIFESYFLEGMDEGAARDQAEKFMNANYSDSIFGKMMYPPEQYYTLGGDIEYMRDQIYSEISAVSDLYGEVDPDNIRLISDEVTARTASEGRPMYRVMFEDENGVLQTTNEYFIPDVASAMDQKREEARQRIEEERALSPIQQKLEQDRINQIIEDETGVRPERAKTRVRPASEIYAGSVFTPENYKEALSKGLEIATTPQRMALEAVGKVKEGLAKKGEASRKRLKQEAERRAEEEARVRAEARKGAK